MTEQTGGHTPGPWKAYNMVNAEGKPMTAEEIGEYVKQCVIQSVKDGGTMDRFLYVSTEAEGGPDICHVGNGPCGPFNSVLIAAAPEMLQALERFLDTANLYAEAWENAKVVVAKAKGERA